MRRVERLERRLATRPPCDARSRLFARELQQLSDEELALLSAAGARMQRGEEIDVTPPLQSAILHLEEMAHSVEQQLLLTEARESRTRKSQRENRTARLDATTQALK